MFEYSLENGKKQFKLGFLYFIVAIVVGFILAMINTFVHDESALIACNVIFGLALIAAVILSTIKIVFGAVVYHAERTASKSKTNN